MFAARRQYWRPRRAALALAATSGLLYALGFCGFDQDLCAWFCLVPALWAMDDPKLGAKGALGCGWAMGFVAHLGVYTWLVGMLRDFGYLPIHWAVVGYIVVCFVQSVLFGVWSMGTYVLVQRYRMPMALAAPVVMVLCEWLTPALFPSYMANSQYMRPWVTQACNIWGVLGLTFMLTWTSAALYAALRWLVRDRSSRPGPVLAMWALSLFAMLLYGRQGTASIDADIAAASRHVTVGLVQTNMGIYEKTDNPEEGLRRHQLQSLEVEAAGADLIVWPETAYYFNLTPEVANVKRQVMGHLHTPLLFGAMRTEIAADGEELFNTAFIADADGALLGSYDKTHLLAFGEFLPLGETIPWLYSLSPQTSRFWRGRHLRPLQWEGLSIGMLICYEDILPAFVRRVMAASPDILVNITNDAWFGNSNEPRIHLALAVFRAVEHRRFLVRSTNTGISAVIDPAGRILHETPVFTRANLLGTVSPMYGQTWYQLLGDWPGYLCVLAVLAYTQASWRPKQTRGWWRAKQCTPP
jgi:apolipoprotein N-acyltransferase